MLGYNIVANIRERLTARVLTAKNTNFKS